MDTSNDDSKPVDIFPSGIAKIMFFLRMHNDNASTYVTRKYWHWKPVKYEKIPIEQINTRMKFHQWCVNNLPSVNNEVYRIVEVGRGFKSLGRFIINKKGIEFDDRRKSFYRWLIGNEHQ